MNLNRPRWLANVPEDWPIARLSFHYEQQLGKMLSQEATSGPCQASYLGNKDVQWDYVDSSTLKTMHFSPADRAKFALLPGDLLVCEGGEVGRTAVWRNEVDDCYFQKAIHRLRPFRTLNDSPRFLFYCLVGAAGEGLFEEHGNRSTIAHLTGEALRAHRFPFPPLPTQRAIADFLDRKTAAIDALIEKKERLVALLAEQRAALIHRAVTRGLDPDVEMKDSGVEWIGEVPAHWEVKRVKFLVSFTTSGSRGWADFYTENAVDPVFLQSGNLGKDLQLNWSVVQHVAPPSSSEGVRTLLQDGDVLICITGAKTGNVAYASELFAKTYINQHVALLRPIELKTLGKFLAFALASHAATHQLLASQYGGTKQGLGLEDVRDVWIVCPPITEQRSTLRSLELQLDASKGASGSARTQIDRLREYRQALITAAVTGQLNIPTAPVSTGLSGATSCL